MKKLFTTLVLLSVLVFSVLAGGRKESQPVNMAVMQGPTGFSSVMLPDYINLSVYPSPNEALAKIVNGELDMAVLPSTAADNLIKKGIQINKIAVVGQGMLSVLGTNKDSKTIAVPGSGSTPDEMATKLYPQYERSYSITSPAQLAQLLIAEKCELAILPQPFVYMVINTNPNIKIFSDVQQKWKNQTGKDNYEMSVLVARSDFANQNPKLLNQVKDDYKKSVERVLANPHEAALIIEEKGIMSAAIAEPTIELCALTFIDIE